MVNRHAHQLGRPVDQQIDFPGVTTIGSPRGEISSSIPASSLPSRSAARVMASTTVGTPILTTGTPIV